MWQSGLFIDLNLEPAARLMALLSQLNYLPFQRNFDFVAGIDPSQIADFLGNHYLALG